jgi:hypothetical protein
VSRVIVFVRGDCGGRGGRGGGDERPLLVVGNGGERWFKSVEDDEETPDDDIGASFMIDGTGTRFVPISEPVLG